MDLPGTIVMHELRSPIDSVSHPHPVTQADLSNAPHHLVVAC